jgi:hypothetical protein
MRTYTIYKAEMPEDLKPYSDVDYYITYEPKYYHGEPPKILETYEVPYKVQFISNFMGESHYNVYPGDYRIRIQHTEAEYEGGHWNYTKEDFEREVNGALNIVHRMGCEPVDEDIFEVVKILYPYVKRGQFNLETKSWDLI